jgi:predicted DsbA family dithiol-disulfide isomerase
VGRRKLQRAISLYQKTYPGGKDDIFNITYRPYYLKYNDLPASVDKKELTDIKLAGISEERRTAMRQKMDQIGRSVGINFRWDGMIGSTRDAHRLVRYSQSKDKEIQKLLLDKIFEAYHELESDISDRAVLTELAIEAGLDGKEVKNFLDSTEYVEIVNDEAKQNKELLKDQGVPTVFVQGEHRVDGAQDPEEFFSLFVMLKGGHIPEY